MNTEIFEQATGYTWQQLTSPCRRREICDTRCILMAYLRAKGYTVVTIAEMFNRKYPWVILTQRKFNTLRECDPHFRNLAERIFTQLQKEFEKL